MDKPKTELTDGTPVTDDHRELKEDGQQKGYVVLTKEERAKGFVRPVRHSYVHNKCKSSTKMGQALSETYARDPKFYGATFCYECGEHYPVAEFVWEGTEKMVGS